MIEFVASIFFLIMLYCAIRLVGMSLPYRKGSWITIFAAVYVLALGLTPLVFLFSG